MTLSPTLRYRLAAAIALILVIYAGAFARPSNRFSGDLLIGVLGVEWLEWVPVVAFAVAAVAALRKAARIAAVSVTSGLIAFFVVHWRHVFDVPLGFALVCLLTLAVLFMMPSER